MSAFFCSFLMSATAMRPGRLGKPAPHRARGLTMVELLTVLAVLGVLLSLGIPAFSNLLADWRVSAATNALGTDMRIARAEALKRSRPVTICPLNSAGACVTDSDDWANGWVIFLDNNGDGARADAGEDDIRIQPALPGLNELKASASGSQTFSPNGLMKPGAAALSYSIKSPSDVATRKLCVGTTGRTVSFKKIADACPGENLLPEPTP